MPLSPAQERSKYNNNVPSIPSRTITFASSARRRAFTPALHPTTPLFIISIVSTLFIVLYKYSEAKSNATIYTTLSVLVLLFSLLGILSAAPPAGPVLKTAHQDQSAFIEEPEARSAAVVVRSQVDPCMPGIQRRFSVPPWLFEGPGDCPSIYVFTGATCFAAQVWLSLCMYLPLPWGVQVVSKIAAAAARTVALRRLRTTSRFPP